MTLAAVLERAPGSLSLLDLALEKPGPHEVLVRMGAAGVCQSDLSVLRGKLPNPLPVVLGHEGAGTVEAVGSEVTSVQPGDRVVVAWLAQCGECFFCKNGQPSLCQVASTAMAGCTLLDGTTRFSRAGEPVYHMAGVGAFARHCIVAERAAIKIPDTIAFAPAALLGCAVVTGYGAAVNAGRVRAGESVAVIGCGGVGLNAIQGARLAGAGPIIAVDVNEQRLELAERVGATTCLVPSDTMVKQVRAATDGYGVDLAIEAVGRTETIREAVRLARRGGRVVLVGAGPETARLDVPAFTGLVVPEKSVTGSFYGSADLSADVARLVELYQSGALVLDDLVSKVFPLAEINDAVSYAASGEGTRTVIEF